ncbi:MAG: hypothetical protein OZSIB_2825 [Candidatus Ozemobacter sibiricus]|uniref:Uncharacterized protein n=1 Tax=Candidatus Ozemobacter sibiricus TaxID=2268124 RepID=A0A367ZSW5_9BACT|nr:MAG: hypothetical protein OZSIB_2825 [Candidatus Ozemobacter sibiricus]
MVDFQINRPEFKLFVVRLKLKAIRARDGFDKEIELTRTILAPQVL